MLALHARYSPNSITPTFTETSPRENVVNTNHESRRRDLCRTCMICVCDKSATLSGTYRGFCRKVGVMEFGLIYLSVIVYFMHLLKVFCLIFLQR